MRGRLFLRGGMTCLPQGKAGAEANPSRPRRGLVQISRFSSKTSFFREDYPDDKQSHQNWQGGAAVPPSRVHWQSTLASRQRRPTKFLPNGL
jgi:hypothetical protein